MKRNLLIAVGLVGASLFGGGLAADAQAAGASYNGITTLTSNQWTPLPNSYNRWCPNYYGCNAFFKWTGGLPGKATLIRLVDCSGNEYARVRIPGSNGKLWLINTQFIIPGSQCLRYEGKTAPGEGNMTEFHNYYWDYN